MSAVGYRLSAIGYRLSADRFGYCFPASAVTDRIVLCQGLATLGIGSGLVVFVPRQMLMLSG